MKVLSVWSCYQVCNLMTRKFSIFLYLFVALYLFIPHLQALVYCLFGVAYMNTWGQGTPITDQSRWVYGTKRDVLWDQELCIKSKLFLNFELCSFFSFTFALFWYSKWKHAFKSRHLRQLSSSPSPNEGRGAGQLWGKWGLGGNFLTNLQHWWANAWA